MNSNVRSSKKRKFAIQEGYRSYLEYRFSQILTHLNLDFKYEKVNLEYKIPLKNYKAMCTKCKCTDIVLYKKYLVDFTVNKTHFEIKGKFSLADRTKIKSVIKNNPDINLIVIFQDWSIKISKKSKHTYKSWCEDNSIKCLDFKNIKLTLPTLNL